MRMSLLALLTILILKISTRVTVNNITDDLQVLDNGIKNIQETMELQTLKTKLEDFFTYIKTCLDD